MNLACIAPVGDLFGDAAGHDDASPRETAVTAPEVSPELVDRFRALIEEVTDELMRNPGPVRERTICRADAISLLLATSQQIDDPQEAAESPLTALLFEEQQKAAAALGSASLAYLKA